ncbi:MAG: alpha-D-glucose phosphate-specific phosphoglucomutase [Acidobacteria bacterium]|nr:alpha-D-glucose phosphate-specific phosphoglucomutase [Acidobacteriota bacterium]
MSVSPYAGKPPLASMVPNIPRIVSAYYTGKPNVGVREQRVSFGTSGHRGSSLNESFNEAHIVAVVGAICRYRKAQGYSGPLFLGKDTHALSEPAFATALEVLAAHGVETCIDDKEGFTPTPVISRLILAHNRYRSNDGGMADGIVITPSHNPPEDGGIKYNPPNGGPAGTEVTKAIEAEANGLLAANPNGVPRIPYRVALQAKTTHPYQMLSWYLSDLEKVIDFDVIRAAGVRMGVDPLGGAGVAYWGEIADHYRLNLTVVNDSVDASFRFMYLDWDGKIRMDCSSPYAMAGLIAMKDRFDVAFACDTDHDRHGIVARSCGLLNPNHYLAVCVDYLFRNRSGWRADAGIGKTVVSSSLIDRVAGALGRRLVEVPVGFKWFVDGLLDGSLGFVGEESAGASFLCKDGSVWTTDKDGMIPGLLAGEMMARTGRDPGELYRSLTEQHGEPVYQRMDAAASPEQKSILGKLSPEQVRATELAGDPIVEMMTAAPGNQAAIGGLKVSTRNGWFAARPSGTENVYKIYAESFRDGEHLKQIQREAQMIVAALFASS